MKKSILWIVFAVVLMSCGNNVDKKKTITIKGHVEFNDPKYKMQILKREGFEKKVVGEFDIDGNNKYNYQMSVEEPGIYYLNCKKWEEVKFWAEDENIEVDFRGLDTAKIKIKNPPFHMIKNAGPNNQLINLLNFEYYRNYQLMISLSQAVYSTKFATKKESANFTSKVYRTLNDDIKARIRELGKQYYKLNSVVEIYNNLKRGEDDVLMSKIEKAHQGYAPLEKMKKEKEDILRKQERVKIGKIAPDFSFPTFADSTKKIGVSSYRGKILLIDFWASWCGPCRSEIPRLKEYYKKYRDKGVEFLSVSIDSKKDAWKKALDEEKMSWEQVLATNSGNEIMDLYQFSGIPFIILLDENGKIIAKNLRGEKIGKEIEKLLSNSSY